MTEKFCLKWNDFQTNVSNTFRKLRTSEHFYDVTLVSDDQQQVQAHKVVLSSSSEYFKNILTSNKHSHPMLCLSGVNKEDLKNVLDFIYNGEIQICQDNLDTFLDIAQRFQLEGLIRGNEERNETEHFEYKHEGFQEHGKVDPGVMDIATESHINPVKTQKIIAMESSNFDNIEEIDRTIDGMMEKVDGTRQRRCIPCGKISSTLQHAKEHAEIHIDGLSFPCQYCNKSFRSRHSLRIHVNHRCHQRQ